MILPSHLGRVRRAVRALLRKRDVEREMADEMRFHVEMEAEELRRAGMAPAEARRRALVAFGGVERFKEEARSGRALRWLEDLGADLRFAARSLRRSPAFTAVAVLALGLGIGVNAVAFGYVDAAAFRALPVDRPNELLAVYPVAKDGDLLNASYPLYEDLRRGATAFNGVAAFVEGPVSLDAGADAEVVWAHHVSPNYFGLLGVRAALGRTLATGDDRAPVVVLGHALWATRFGADPAVVGRTVRLNGSPFTVVGVMPPAFLGTRLFAYAPALWAPVGMHAQTIPGSDSMLTARTWTTFQVIARLRAGAGLAQAQASLDAVARRLAEAYPDRYKSLRFRLFSNRTPINPWLAPPERMRAIGRISLLGVGLVLLIACADVASLLLARMTVRRREVAIRLSLGASRGRLVRQLLTESLVLAALGCLAALPLAAVAIDLSAKFGPPVDFATAYRPAVDPRLLAFTAAVTVAAGLAFGLAPALQSSSRRIAGTLRDGGAWVAGRRSRLREALVVAQLTLSLVVLVAAGLFARSLGNARRMDPGFRLDGGVVFTLDPRLLGYDTARARALYDRLLARLAALPGVRAVTRATSVPLNGNNSSTIVFAEGGGTSPEDGVRVDYNIVGPRYFETVGTPILDGREFAERDSAGPVEAVVVNEVLAGRLWPGLPAVGRRIRVGDSVLEVVGVSRAAKSRTLGEAPRPYMSLSIVRNPASRTVVIMRADGDPGALYQAVRREVRALDPALPIVGLKTLREHVAVSYSAAESGASMTAMFGALALLLAAAGLYGVIAYAVATRTREIAVRAALGASRRRLLGMILFDVVKLVLPGVSVGLVITVALVRLNGVNMGIPLSHMEPLAYVVGAAIALLVAVLASLPPVRRAASVQPMVAMRSL
jgi:putative ABC transport system permease protein